MEVVGTRRDGGWQVQMIPRLTSIVLQVTNTLHLLYRRVWHVHEILHDNLHLQPSIDLAVKLPDHKVGAGICWWVQCVLSFDP